MSAEEELSKWLRRKDKTFQENLQFAIKTWQSVEFPLTTKYEIILHWISNNNCVDEKDVVEEDFKDFLKLKAQPGLINRDAKEAFIGWCLKMASTFDHKSRKWSELYNLLVDFEILQDLFRVNYNLHAQVYKSLFFCYEKYLENIAVVETNFLNTNETEFFVSILNKLKETIRRCGDVAKFEQAFTSITLNALVNVLLTMRKFKVDFLEEFIEIERQLTFDMNANSLMTRIMDMPFHVRLLTMECSIVNRKGITDYIDIIIRNIFSRCMTNELLKQEGSLNITMAAYILEMLRRHDVSLTQNQSTLQYLGDHVAKAVKVADGNYMREILMLLCAALRLNPLILENHIFKITVKMILAPKSGNKEEQQLFEEYLVLLMDMFRRLSRAEKFVANLLKTINDTFKHGTISLNTKRKSSVDSEIPSKMQKVNADVNTTPTKAEGKVAKYLNILFEDFFKPVLTQKKYLENRYLSATASFAALQNYWPSNPVGIAFSKIITGLVSKPSVVIWKTLLYALNDLITFFKTRDTLGDNDLFRLDFHVALLCQYCSGCKLAEQSEKFIQDINSQRIFMTDVLQTFGKFILEREHQPRTMAAFLEVSYYATCLELILSFYRPDGCGHETLQPSYTLASLHGFLSPDEWNLIQQRVLNFGQTSCKYLLQRLQLQKSQSTLLLLDNKGEGQLLDRSIGASDKEQLCTLLKSNNANWLISQMTRSGKMTVASCITHCAELLPLACEDLDLLELVSLAIYEEITLSLSSKNASLKSLACDFDEVRQCVETSASEILIKRLIDAINSRAEEAYKVKNMDVDQIKNKLDILSQLPLGQLRRQRKTIIFALHLCLYRDLKFGKAEDLAEQALEQLKDILHFGQQVLIFKYFPADCLLKLLPCESCWELYEFLFATIKKEEKGTDQFLQDLAEIIQASQSDHTIDNDKRKLLLIAIETLSSLTGPYAKRMRKHLEAFLKIFAEYLNSNFKESSSDANSKKHKKFVQKTISGFASYASVLLTRAAKAKDEKENKTETLNDVLYKQEIDEDFRRINKIYIGHSIDYRNPHALRLMRLALNHKEVLHLDQDEIEFVLTNYWTQINEDLRHLEDQNNKTIETAVKLIIGNKTNEDLLLTLKALDRNNQPENFANILRLVGLIAKCPFSIIKGAIFNEQYKKITFNITVLLKRNEQQQLIDSDLVLELLHCHQYILDNKMVPITTDTMDSILSFLMDITMKKFPLNDANLRIFHSLHLAMTEVCSSMIKQRHLLLMDRAPQYMHIFKDLLQSVVWYKSDRQKDTALPSGELDDLAELAMKLEALMHLVAQNSVAFKRVAPFVLTFIINLMVSNKRPTTLYNNIKTHIESICYDLVGICDHRVGRFILRCSNEAGRQLYELLVKDYQKYHKFKGKV
ncbi:uncharacterized protein LOC106094396 [Stomoxys calcitrans]|uniref:uncharacterized protein LOC106094396 n=1 Tax=Stomoxys calcitrans TaxID=35570 RepID=UPI0027E3A04D|nr:uncharacterized protein LOC106094396 [Stomoxys calcitrans]